MQYICRVFIVAMAFLLIGCSESQEPQNSDFVVTPELDGQPAFLEDVTQESGYPEPAEAGYPASANESVTNTGYPAPVSAHSINGRSQTAIQSYDLVYPVAIEEFHPDAYLSTIAPSNIMLRNLGNPPVLPGWFFKFRKPESRREFIIHVVDDIITGTTLTESAMDAGPGELPIDLSQVELDSDDVLAQFRQTGSERGIWSDAILYDLELVHLEGANGQVWSVVDPTTSKWLFSIDAKTGEETENPHQ